MHTGIVEIVSLNTPCIRKNLFPFCSRINHRLHFGYTQWFLEFLVFCRLNNRKLVIWPDSQYFPFVIRKQITVSVIKDRLFFTLICIEILYCTRDLVCPCFGISCK